MRAKLKFTSHAPLSEREGIPTFIHKLLSRHAHALRSSPWRGLPELTNKEGAECPDSCPVQAWSMATLLDTLYDMEHPWSSPAPFLSPPTRLLCLNQSPDLFSLHLYETLVHYYNNIIIVFSLCVQ